MGHQQPRPEHQQRHDRSPRTVSKRATKGGSILTYVTSQPRYTEEFYGNQHTHAINSDQRHWPLETVGENQILFGRTDVHAQNHFDAETGEVDPQIGEGEPSWSDGECTCDAAVSAGQQSRPNSALFDQHRSANSPVQFQYEVWFGGRPSGRSLVSILSAAGVCIACTLLSASR